MKQLKMDDYTFTSCTRSELKQLNASDFGHGDVVHVRGYYIYIQYKRGDRQYTDPALCSYVETDQGKPLDCTAGSSRGFTPYYIDEFKSR